MCGVRIITIKEMKMSDTVLFDKLLKLRLPAFREGLREQQANPKYADLSFEERLALLVDQECTRRYSNRIQKALQTASFPMQATLEDLDLAPARGLDRRQVLELGQCTWIGNNLNVLVLGPTGSGKSYLACSLGTAAIRLGYSVRYFRTSRLFHTLSQARQDVSYSNVLRSLARTDLLILDDWLRDELTPIQVQDILEVLDDRYGYASTIVASQIPVSDWFIQIANPTFADAILDRLIHNAYRLQLTGESQRKLRAIRTMPHT
jgi:DNA replication protein DnaC